MSCMGSLLCNCRRSIDVATRGQQAINGFLSGVFSCVSSRGTDVKGSSVAQGCLINVRLIHYFNIYSVE